MSSVSPPVSKEVKEKVKQFLSSYLVLPDYLDDAASKLRGIVDWAVKVRSVHFKFELQELNQKIEIN